MANPASLLALHARRRAAAAAVVCAIISGGCGRIGFDLIDASGDGPLTDGDDATALADARDASVLDVLDATTDARPSTDIASERDASTDTEIPDAAPTRARICRASGTIACLDFETDPAVEWARVVSATSTLRFDTTRSFRGRAMHSTVTRTNDTVVALLQLPMSPTRFTTGLYVSAWIRAENSGTTTAFPVLELNNAQRADAMRPFRKVSLDHLGVPAVPGEFALASPGGYLTETGFARGRWTCARIFVAAAGPGRMQTSVHADGRMIAATQDFDPSTFDTVQVGLVGIGDPGELWVDDVYVGDRDVGCLPAL